MMSRTQVMTIGGAACDSIIDYENPETLNLHSSRGTLSYLLFEEGPDSHILIEANFFRGFKCT